ncbi:MAG: helix-turn-helix domain-containing protein [Myxococcaceae bacterium]
MQLSLLVVGAHRPSQLRLRAPALVVAIESASVDVRSGGQRWAVDRSTCLLVPRGQPLQLRRDQASARVAVLGLGSALIDDVCTLYARLGMRRERLQRWLARPALLPRTIWVHEIVHRYLFERCVLGERANAAALFLEEEVLKEIYFLFRDRDEGTERASNAHLFSASVQRALEHVEAHLFEPVDVPTLASKAGASESTLLRAFRRELASTPSRYWRSRKLDEAMVLLRSGGLSVSEVSLEVGYDNPTAFGFAFRKRFGQPPSSFRSRVPVRAAP